MRRPPEAQKVVGHRRRRVACGFGEITYFWRTYRLAEGRWTSSAPRSLRLGGDRVFRGNVSVGWGLFGVVGAAQPEALGRSRISGERIGYALTQKGVEAAWIPTFEAFAGGM